MVVDPTDRYTLLGVGTCYGNPSSPHISVTPPNIHQAQTPDMDLNSGRILRPWILILILSLATKRSSSSRYPGDLLSFPPPLPILPIPSAPQVRWQRGEMAMFLHFGMNTFTDSEWGTGQADPWLFNPTESLDARQWASVAKEAGFSHIILTAKHHDGFCLWPSAYTNYSVSNSPWKNGTGDIVQEVAEAAREVGIGLGLYLSPWDRHESSYGQTLVYNEYYLAQLRELLTNYGTIEEVWLDGAKGNDAKLMDYYFDEWFSVIRQLQPGAVIFSDAGPDARWVGDEGGVSGSTCWSMFNSSDVTIGDTVEHCEFIMKSPWLPILLNYLKRLQGRNLIVNNDKRMLTKDLINM